MRLYLRLSVLGDESRRSRGKRRTVRHSNATGRLLRLVAHTSIPMGFDFRTLSPTNVQEVFVLIPGQSAYSLALSFAPLTEANQSDVVAHSIL